MKRWFDKVISNRWRLYSGFLTLVMVAAIGCSAASATKYSIENGLIKVQSPLSNSWENLTFGASKPSSYTETKLDAQFQSIAEDLGIMSTAAGGLTQAELEDSLANYVGKRISNYTFLGGSGVNISATVSDLYDAIAKNQIYSTMPLYSTYDGVYLNESGKVVSGVPADSSLASFIRRGFAGLSKNLDTLSSSLVGVGSYYGFLYSANSSLGSSDFRTYTNPFEFLTALGSSVTSNQQRIYYLEQQIKDLNALWYDTLNQSLVGPGSATATLWNSSDKTEEEVEYDNLLAAVTGLGTSIQNDLAKLRYVLASDQDIEIAEKQEPVKDAISDNFTGDSSAAVKDSDVGDMAGFSNDLQSGLNTGVSASEAVGALGGSGEGWGFWSSDVAAELHGNVPSTVGVDDPHFITAWDPDALDKYLAGVDGGNDG